MTKPAQYPDDNPDALRPQISLNEAYVCNNGECPEPYPLVVCEKHLCNAKAGRRFFVICPTCNWGFKIISSIVVDRVKPVIPDDCCVWDFSGQDEPPKKKTTQRKTVQRKPRKRKK